MESPSSAVAIRVAGTKWQPSSPAPARIAAWSPSPVRSRSGLLAKSAVGVTWLLTSAVVRPGVIFESASGPVVTTYEFKPDAGVKYSKIVGLTDDLALALEAESIRIDRVSGKGNVGIEIPNEKRETIYLRELLESDTFQQASGRLPLSLGKAVNGDVCVADLAVMPHLLIAGSTGTGKSVGLNCMISSILFRSTPEEVRRPRISGFQGADGRPGTPRSRGRG